MYPELWFLDLIYKVYPVSFISLVLILTGFLKALIVCRLIYKWNQSIIERLEKRLENCH